MSTQSSNVPCTFTHFIVSIGQSAFVAMGDVTGPPDATVHPALARYNLDLLRLLQAKTQGNLDNDEQQLLDTLVAEIGARLDKQPVAKRTP